MVSEANSLVAIVIIQVRGQSGLDGGDSHGTTVSNSTLDLIWVVILFSLYSFSFFLTTFSPVYSFHKEAHELCKYQILVYNTTSSMIYYDFYIKLWLKCYHWWMDIQCERQTRRIVRFFVSAIMKTMLPFTEMGKALGRSLLFCFNLSHFERHGN